MSPLTPPAFAMLLRNPRLVEQAGRSPDQSRHIAILPCKLESRFGGVLLCLRGIFSKRYGHRPSIVRNHGLRSGIMRIET